jgi:hypothetical protein
MIEIKIYEVAHMSSSGRMTHTVSPAKISPDIAPSLRALNGNHVAHPMTTDLDNLEDESNRLQVNLNNHASPPIGSIFGYIGFSLL